MKLLIAASVHHPEVLARFRVQQPAQSLDPIFPPSQNTHFWVKGLRHNGHEVEGFIRNQPVIGLLGARRSARFKGLRLLERVVAVINSRAPHLNPDYAARNRRLIAHVERFHPDALLLSGGNQVIYPETLAALKKRWGCKIVYLSGVSPIVFSNALERAAASLYDLVVVNDFYHGVQWLELGAKQMEALPLSACDPEFHQPADLTPEEQSAYGCDLGFVGTLVPEHLYRDRVEALRAVRDLGLGVWSIHGIPPELQENYRGEALGETMLRALCGSKIQINPHGTFMRYGGNMRLFEAAACGVFQIADDLPGVRKWFEVGQTIEVYHDPAHLRAQVIYYLQHADERSAIARAAREHVLKYHTYDQRMRALGELIAALK